jgi:biotin transport system ATP-binding protein
MTLLEVSGVSHRFPNGKFGLRDLDLRILEHEFLVIAGPNGSGKTLLMRHLNGLLSPTNGTILYRGLDIRKDLNRVRRGVGLVFQDADSQIVGQTAAEDVAFGPENLGLPREEVGNRVRRAFELTGISHLADLPARALSGGEKRLLALAGVLAMEPEAVILDEPFANLDFGSVRRVLSVIVELHEGGRTVILITHELEKALAHATRLVIMREGRIREAGAPGDLLGSLEQHGLISPRFAGGSLETMTWLR